MDSNSLIIILVIGGFSGWLAGQIKNGYGLGLVGNIVVGIAGSFVGSWLFAKMGISAGGGLLGSIITSVVGALALLVLIGFVRSK